METIANVEKLKEYENEPEVFVDFNTVGETELHITKEQRGKYKDIRMWAYTKSLGMSVFSITGSKEIRRFMSKANIVSVYTHYEIPLLLTAGIEIENKCDIRDLVYAETLKEISPKQLFIAEGFDTCTESTKENWMQAIEIIYNKYKHMKETDNYKIVSQLRRLFAYQSYFGIDISINKKKLAKLREESWEEINKARDKWANEYGKSTYGPKFAKNKIGEETGIAIESVSIRELLKIKNTEGVESKAVDLYMNCIMAEKRANRLNINNVAVNTIKNKFRLYKSNTALSMIGIDKSDIIESNENKCYFILITGKYVIYKYIEKMVNNVDIEYKNYADYIASLLFKKDIKNVTDKDRETAKLYNFYRSVHCVNEGSITSLEYKVINRLGVDIYDYIQAVPKFKAEDFKKVEKAIAFKIANLDKLCRKFGYAKCVLDEIIGDNIIMKVSNNINPFVAMKLIADTMDTTQDIGIRVFDKMDIGTNYKELMSNEKGDINYEFIEHIDGKYNINDKLRNNKESVWSEYKKWKKSNNN